MKKLTLLLLISIALVSGPNAACRRSAGPDGEPAGEMEPAAVAASRTAVPLSLEAQAGGGIVVEAASLDEIAASTTALGELEFDARRVAGVAARAAGRIERLAAWEGDRVAAGSVLAEIYSPDFLAAQAEVLQAAARAARLSGRPEEAAARSFLEAARRKLAPLGLSQGEIEALIASGQARPLLAVRAPLSGVILESRAVAGAAVAEGADLFRLADPAVLWACVRLPEKDLAAVKPGLAADIRTQAYADRTFPGRLTLVAASMDPATRTVEGRIEVPNAGGVLKPGMFIEARLDAAAKRPALTVPAGAVQEFASGKIVFVRTKPTEFALRPVQTGDVRGGRIEILAGLAAGEEVAASGSFMLKSELMKASLGE